MILNLWDSINKGGEKFQSWIIEHGNNPILWTGLFFLGLFVFLATYRALNKNK